jgi:hypothetical protein
MSGLLTLVRAHRKALARDLVAMSDAELLLEMADCLANDLNERPLIAAALAVSGWRSSTIVDVKKLLQEAGISGFEAERLTSMRDHCACRDLEVMFRAAPTESGQVDLHISREDFQKMHDLAVLAGTIDS